MKKTVLLLILLISISIVYSECCLDENKYCEDISSKDICSNRAQNRCQDTPQCTSFGCCVTVSQPMILGKNCPPPNEFDVNDPFCEEKEFMKNKGCCVYYSQAKAKICLPERNDYLNFEQGISEEKCLAKEGYTKQFYKGLSGSQCQLICRFEKSILNGDAEIQIMNMDNFPEHWIQIGQDKKTIGYSTTLLFKGLPIGNYKVIIGINEISAKVGSIIIEENQKSKYDLRIPENTNEINSINNEDSGVLFAPVAHKISGTIDVVVSDTPPEELDSTINIGNTRITIIIVSLIILLILIFLLFKIIKKRDNFSKSYQNYNKQGQPPRSYGFTNNMQGQSRTGLRNRNN